MIILGSDHAGFELKEALKKHLEKKGFECIDKGTYNTDSVDYAPIAVEVSREVLDNEGALGVLCCGTGIGISIAANKVKGIRAACCSNVFCAKMTRMHNNANIIALGGRVTDFETAKEMIDVFIETPFEGGRHQRRIDQISAIENGKL
jgi:ribose 5-phosphate isomerase B